MSVEYICNSCGRVIDNPYEMKMKEFCIGCSYETSGVFPYLYKRKVKVHLCDDCFVGLNNIVEKMVVDNGVTIRNWYPASTSPKDGLYIVKLSNNQKVPARFNCGKWIMCEGYKNITKDVMEWKEIE